MKRRSLWHPFVCAVITVILDYAQCVDGARQAIIHW